jgi:NAD(P)-dependent dehydrogenase (short-subunit alcohol dehydrogenase family)
MSAAEAAARASGADSEPACEPASAPGWLRDPAALFDVRGRSAIVTGASGAFGALAAQVLAGAGARLTLSAGKAHELTQVAQQCRSLGATVATIARRHNSESDANAIVGAALEAYGAVDILVVASGMNDVAPIVDMSSERFERVMQANVTGSWLMARSVGAQLIRQARGGKVVLMSSARGLLGHPAGYSAYCASKSAIDGITRALGCEWGKYAITVNAIAPTVFRSALTAWMFEDNDKANSARAGFLTRVPLGRLGEPTDLAGPLLFLCSRASDFYTGHILYADGGYTAG